MRKYFSNQLDFLLIIDRQIISMDLEKLILVFLIKMKE